MTLNFPLNLHLNISILLLLLERMDDIILNLAFSLKCSVAFFAGANFTDTPALKSLRNKSLSLEVPILLLEVEGPLRQIDTMITFGLSIVRYDEELSPVIQTIPKVTHCIIGMVDEGVELRKSQSFLMNVATNKAVFAMGSEDRVVLRCHMLKCSFISEP